MNATQQLQNQLPSAEEAAIAKVCSQDLAALLDTRLDAQQLTLTDKEGQAHAVNIPVPALRLLVDVLTELGDGNTVKLVPVHAELTTQEGADLLNVSRPTFIKLLDEGAIPFHRIGNRRKVTFSDLQSYKAVLEGQRLGSLAELSQLDQELGLGYE